ncbi:MAG TPA: hypothetical protein VFH23_08500 [Jiangellaceae bacterium]|nr:hypothetical protein [Jiangellaceae bacterium]
MTTIQDRLNRQDRDPEPGDQLIGQIVEITERETQYGAYPLLVVADDEGAVHSVHCLRGGLLWPVVRIRPKVGDRIGVRYDGVTGTSSAHRYVVAFENATETAPDWERIEKSQRERSKDGNSAGTSDVDSAWPVNPPDDGPEPPPEEGW